MIKDFNSIVDGIYAAGGVDKVAEKIGSSIKTKTTKIVGENATKSQKLEQVSDNIQSQGGVDAIADLPADKARDALRALFVGF